MLRKLINLVPQHILVTLYKHTPFTKLKNWIVYRAQHRFLASVLGIITDESGNIMLLKHVYRSEPWGMPGGWMELEQPELALKREIKEETGLDVEITSIAKALFGRKPTRVDLILHGRLIGGTFRSSVEISDICFCQPGEWPEGMPKSQQILIASILNKDEK